MIEVTLIVVMIAGVTCLVEYTIFFTKRLVQWWKKPLRPYEFKRLLFVVNEVERKARSNRH